MRTIQTTIYKFNELSEQAKKKAIEKLKETQLDYDWWKFTYEDSERIGLRITEFDIDRNKHVKGEIIGKHEETAKLILEEHGETCDSHKLAASFLEELKRIEDLGYSSVCETDIEDLEQEFLSNLLKLYANILQEECEYLQSDNSIIECINTNDYEFTGDGKLI